MLTYIKYIIIFIAILFVLFMAIKKARIKRMRIDGKPDASFSPVLFPMDTLLVVSNRYEEIFKITAEGEIYLRGKLIGKDKEAAEIISKAMNKGKER